ncbi:MAG: hypothetical protein EAZ18_10605, partial [Oscillatoriales cyanobacterium]
ERIPGLNTAARIDSFKVCRRTKNPLALTAGECQLKYQTSTSLLTPTPGLFHSHQKSQMMGGEGEKGNRRDD